MRRVWFVAVQKMSGEIAREWGSMDDYVQVLMTYGFWDEVLQFTQQAAANPEAYMKHTRLVWMRLLAFHATGRNDEFRSLYSETKYTSLEMDEDSFVAWCLMGIDCDMLDIVKTMAEKYIQNAQIKCGKQRAGSHTMGSGVPVVCSLYTLEILCKELNDFEAAEAWVKQCILLSQQQKQVLISKVNGLKPEKISHVNDEFSGSGKETSTEMTSNRSQVAESSKSASFEPWESVQHQLAKVTGQDFWHDDSTVKKIVYGVGGVAIVCAALVHRKRIKRSLKGLWNPLKASVLETSWEALKMSLTLR